MLFETALGRSEALKESQPAVMPLSLQLLPTCRCCVSIRPACQVSPALLCCPGRLASHDAVMLPGAGLPGGTTSLASKPCGLMDRKRRSTGSAAPVG